VKHDRFVWPFEESPGEFSQRLQAAVAEFGQMLPAVRHVLIEQPPALNAVVEPNMRHPKIQHYIGLVARRTIELQIVERLLEDGEAYEPTASDMEYWNSTHDLLLDLIRRAGR
jgi:hypothetical protein